MRKVLVLAALGFVSTVAALFNPGPSSAETAGVRVLVQTDWNGCGRSAACLWVAQQL